MNRLSDSLQHGVHSMQLIYITVTSQKVRAIIEPVQGWDQHFRDA
jgi:hypothetical protein